MAGATTVMGFVPAYATIGILAPFLLTLVAPAPGPERGRGIRRINVVSG